MKSYTDLQQSRKLAEILPLESADMCYIKHTSSDNPNWEFNEDFPPMILGSVPINEIAAETLPCWSLAALFSILPKEIVYNKNIVYLEFHVWQNSLEYVNNADYILHITRSYDNPVDACYEMILKLHELKML